MDEQAPIPTRTPIIACHECGTVHRMTALQPGRAASCTTCGATLYRDQRDSIERTLGLTAAALFLFAIANLLPFMTLKLEGREQPSTIMTGVLGLHDAGMWPLAAIVFAAAVLMPLLKLLALLYVLLPLQVGQRAPGMATIFRWVETIHPWAMMEVFLLGVIVAYVKLVDLATIELGVALFAFIGVIVLMILADRTLDPREVWHWVSPQATDKLLTEARSGRLVSCHGCDQLFRVHDLSHATCTRCGADLHKRKPNSIATGWALTVAACILYIPANILPIMTVVHFGQGAPSTILGGVKLLIHAGMLPIAALVFLRQRRRAGDEAGVHGLSAPVSAAAIHLAAARSHLALPRGRSGRPLVHGRHLHDLDPGRIGQSWLDRDDRTGCRRHRFRRRGHHHHDRRLGVRPEAHLGHC